MRRFGHQYQLFDFQDGRNAHCGVREFHSNIHLSTTGTTSDYRTDSRILDTVCQFVPKRKFFLERETIVLELHSYSYVCHTPIFT